MTLSATPPYTVDTGDRDLMLEKIMTTKLDVTPLRQHKISDAGIDFIKRLLHLEPQLRPTERECLEHPWLTPLLPTELAGIDELTAFEPGRSSQMPLRSSYPRTRPGNIHESIGGSVVVNDDDVVGGGSEEVGEVDLDEQLYRDVCSSKRMKTADAANLALPSHVEVPSSPDVPPPHPLAYGVEPGGDAVGAAQRRPARAERLFGEVGASAFGSSGIIPPDYLNLEVSNDRDGLSGEASGDGADDSYLTSQASTFDRVLHPASETRPTRAGQSAFDDHSQHLPDPVLSRSHGNLNSHPAAAASLLGAESLVGQLNVTSISSPEDSVSQGAVPAVPGTPKMDDASSPGSDPRQSGNEGVGKQADSQLERGQHQHRQQQEELPAEEFARRVNLAVLDAYDKDPSHHAVMAARLRMNGKNTDPMSLDSATASMPDLGGPRIKVDEMQDLRAATQPDAIAALAVTIPNKPCSSDDTDGGVGMNDEEDAKEDATRSMTLAPKSESQEPEGDGKGLELGSMKPPPPPSSIRSFSHSASSQPEAFARPLPVLGKLISTPRSVIALTMHLNQRESSWGRGGANSIVYPNGQDTRVPKYAFKILFWKPGLRELMTKGVTWTDVSDVHAVILLQKTARRIAVNGVPLGRRQKAGFPYGRLYTGDVITIGEDNHHKDAGKEIQLVCEFYHGASTSTRPKGGKRAFEVEHGDFSSNGNGGPSLS